MTKKQSKIEEPKFSIKIFKGITSLEVKIPKLAEQGLKEIILATSGAIISR